MQKTKTVISSFLRNRENSVLSKGFTTPKDIFMRLGTDVEHPVKSEPLPRAYISDEGLGRCVWRWGREGKYLFCFKTKHLVIV